MLDATNPPPGSFRMRFHFSGRSGYCWLSAGTPVGSACCHRMEAVMNPEQETQDGVLVAEDLIEEVSIDGMCGVY